MSTRQIIFTGLALTLVIGGAAAIMWFKKQAEKLKQYTYNFIGYSIKKIGLKDTQIDVYLELGNESDLNLTVKSYNISAELNGKYIGNFSGSGLNTVIPAHQKGQIVVGINFNPIETLKNTISGSNITAFFTDKNKLVFGFKGKISLSANGLPINNFNIDTRLSLAEMTKTNGRQKRPTVA